MPEGHAPFLGFNLVDYTTCFLKRRFAGNNAQAGGGLFQLDVQGEVEQCAFEDNVGSSSDESFGSGGGLSQSGGSGNVSNSIFVGNMVRLIPTGLD